MSGGMNISRFLQLLRGQEDAAPQRRAGRRGGFQTTLQGVRSQRAQKPLALVKRGREVSFQNIPFFDKDGNRLQIQTDQRDGKMHVRVKKSGRIATRSLQNPTTNGMRLEARLSGNGNVDQIIPNVKNHVRQHLKSTRELRHGILSGELQTPGTRNTRLKKQLVEENGSELDKLVAKLSDVRGEGQQAAASLASLGMRVSRKAEQGGDDANLLIGMAEAMKGKSRGKGADMIGQVIDTGDIEEYQQLKNKLQNPLERRVSAFTPRRVDKNGNSIGDETTAQKKGGRKGEAAQSQTGQVNQTGKGKDGRVIIPLKANASKGEAAPDAVEEKVVKDAKERITVSLRQEKGKVSGQGNGDSRIVSRVAVNANKPQAPGEEVIRQREQLQAFTRQMTRGGNGNGSNDKSQPIAQQVAPKGKQDVDESQIKRLVKDAVKQTGRSVAQENRPSLEAEAFLKRRSGRPNHANLGKAAPSDMQFTGRSASSHQPETESARWADETERSRGGRSRLTRQAVLRAFPRNGNTSENSGQVKQKVHPQPATGEKTEALPKVAVKGGEPVPATEAVKQTAEQPVLKTDARAEKPQVAEQKTDTPVLNTKQDAKSNARPQESRAQTQEKSSTPAQMKQENTQLTPPKPSLAEGKADSLLADGWRLGRNRGDDAALKSDSRRNVREVLTDTWQNVKQRLSRRSSGKESSNEDSNRQQQQTKQTQQAEAAKAQQQAVKQTAAEFKEAVQTQQAQTTAHNQSAATTAKVVEGWQSSMMNRGADSVAEGVRNLTEVLQKIEGRAELLKAGESASIRVQLRPKALGSVAVLISKANKKYDVLVQADGKEAARHIEAATQQIREHLSQSGVQLNKFDVDSNNQRQQTRGEATGDNAGNSRGRGGWSGSEERSDEFLQQEEVEQHERLRQLALGTNTVEYVG